MQLCDFARDFPRFADDKVKFYDVFDPQFEVKMGNILRDRAAVDPATRASLNDPMCIGYFIDNELRFNDIIAAVLGSEPQQPAKTAFIAFLRTRYSGIDRLNDAWQTGFADWQTLAASRSRCGVREGAPPFSPPQWPAITRVKLPTSSDAGEGAPRSGA